MRQPTEPTPPGDVNRLSDEQPDPKVVVEEENFLDEAIVHSKWKKFSTTALLNLSFIVEKADEQCLPAAYTFIGRSFNATPSQLSSITTCRGLVQAFSSPVAGLLGDRVSRTRLIAVGTMLWAVMTAGIALSRSLYTAMLCSAFNGIGLALVLPAVQSLIADFFPSLTRGRAFGFLFFISNLGGMAGAYFATDLGGKMPFGEGGYEGWRLVFFFIAAVSALISILLVFFAVDPRKKTVRVQQQSWTKWVGAQLRSMWHDVTLVLRIPTFIIIVLQGIVGSMPWMAMGFAAAYLQGIGFTDHNAAVLGVIFNLANACGAFLGGYLADMLLKCLPRYARVYVAQFSVLMTFPFSLIFFKVLPTMGPNHTPEDNDTNSLFKYYALVMGAGGLLISWCGTNNSAIFAEIVPEQLRSSIYAFDRSFEGAVGTLGAPLAALIAEHIFGYSGALGDASKTPLQKHDNAVALGYGMLAMYLIPWGICFLFYFGLYFTLPRDREASAELGKRLQLDSQQRQLEMGAIRPLTHSASGIQLNEDGKALSQQGAMRPTGAAKRATGGNTALRRSQDSAGLVRTSM